ncbi:BREX-1 system adenine-specific DNA-methyltransferase PglX [Trichococcus sp. K1Tr]|uniref:BREX-1 system adenine-specific DNA-methyltransferase PglX n=1 Tax=Trichococcus sp. K1Tr TaxID=3020847 RepID=UPI00232B6E7B|nr:BREX-1 system adenine-specific DNA-methyltransferase PglX [Trichococcus sp. K1Tr]MDB6353116.1 BREX-1 system adenine-specific DNA-methyltransferase PglX [Trichococcus sp. K1Tr]
MDNTALKKFAVSARHKISTGVRNRAAQFGITEQGIAPIQSLADGFIVNGHIFDNKTQTQYEHLRRRVEIDGYEAVMETASYTWFNRLVALRFMEVHDYLPIRTRILSSLKANKVEPDAVTEVLQLVDELSLDKELIYHLQDTHNTNELFKYIIEKQGMQLEKMLPNVFSPVEGDFYLLLPNDLLQDIGIIRDLITLISEESWDDIEIVGWLYQFYVSEEKDQIFSDLKKNKKIGKQSIGPATQLFTPKWIVEYLVDNSLGRLWIENNASSNLKDKLHYYLDAAEQTPEVMEQLAALKYEKFKPEDIKVMDPAMGSGHMLLHAFDVLREIYLERGYNPREIPQLIVENNLYGIDIDKRAAQLASFAIAMKARSYDRRFFSREVTFNLIGFEESNGLVLFHNTSLPNEDAVNAELENLYAQFFDAKIYGSILRLEFIEVKLIEEAIQYLRTSPVEDIIEQGYLNFEIPIIEELLEQHRLLTMRYGVVVTNPPYMGSNGMDSKLSSYVKKNYPNTKSDLFAVFMDVSTILANHNGYYAMINQQSWMFLNSFQRLRESILKNQTIIDMAHTGTRTFPEVGGEVVQNTAFVLLNSLIDSYKGRYARLIEINRTEEKAAAILNVKYTYHSDQKKFSIIPGAPIAYWVSDKIYDSFKYDTIEKYAISDGQTKTGDNNKYLRLIWEVERKTIGKGKKWVIHAKGGGYRRWFGNVDTIIDWSEKAKSHYRKDHVARIAPEYIWFRRGVSWNLISSSERFSVRLLENDSTFNLAAPSIFFDDENLNDYVLALLNSKYAEKIIRILNPTLNTNIGDVMSIPLKISRDNEIIELARVNIAISKNDWNSFETSLNFEKHPLVTESNRYSKISETYAKWNAITEERFNQLKMNEEKLNRIFIDIYSLQDELTPEVEDKDVTVRKADVKRDIRNFLSYLIGVVFGRYRLDKQGLAFAGGEFKIDEYGSYKPDKDNIIPITAEHYFEDDIVSKITELVTIIYGKDTLNENLQFIATHLGMKESETAEDTIRRYFMKDFYKDHLKIYQKRPIYWQFSSGKKGAFKGLMYLHRYDKYTLARIRTDYVLKLTTTLNQLIEHAQVIIDGNVSAKEVARARKERETYEAQLQELREYDLILKQLADQEIDLDLDDGVKLNYAKFQEIPFKKDNGRSEKMNLFEKI